MKKEWKWKDLLYEDQVKNIFKLLWNWVNCIYAVKVVGLDGSV